jgi:hypothetical protein
MSQGYPGDGREVKGPPYLDNVPSCLAAAGTAGTPDLRVGRLAVAVPWLSNRRGRWDDL